MSNKNVSPDIVRYMRPLSLLVLDDDAMEYELVDGNTGGITFAFNIDYAAKKLYVGVAICKAVENFEKAQGRVRAIQVLHDPEAIAHFELAYDESKPLVEGFIDELFNKNDEKYKAYCGQSFTRTLMEQIVTISEFNEDLMQRCSVHDHLKMLAASDPDEEQCCGCGSCSCS
jgi:hypothetical protein